MREVEAQAVGGNQRAGLVHMLAQHLLEGGVEQVGCGVVAADELAAAVVDAGGDNVAHVHAALGNLADVRDDAALVMAGVGHVKGKAVGQDAAGVCGLAAHLGVEGGAVEHDLGLVARLGSLDLLALAHDGHDLGAVELVGLIAAELGLGQRVGQGGPHVVEGAPGVAVCAGAGTLALLGHAAVEGVHVNAVACGLADLAGEVDGEPVGVVQLEGNLAGKAGALVELLELGGKASLARVERAVEALLLCREDAQDEGLVLG